MSDEEFFSIVDELGMIRISTYYKAYISVKGDKDLFFDTFRDYLDNRPKAKNGYRKISPFSFKCFVFDKFPLKL